MNECKVYAIADTALIFNQLSEHPPMGREFRTKHKLLDGVIIATARYKYLPNYDTTKDLYYSEHAGAMIPTKERAIVDAIRFETVVEPEIFFAINEYLDIPYGTKEDLLNKAEEYGVDLDYMRKYIDDALEYMSDYWDY